MVVEALSSFGYGHEGGDNKMVHGLIALDGIMQVKGEKSQHCWKLMHKHHNSAFKMLSVSISLFVVLLLLSYLFRIEAQVNSAFIYWKPLQTEDSEIEIDPKHRWIAQRDSGWEGWLRVWRLKEDLTIGEKILDIGGRKGANFFIDDIEWIGNQLLISIVEGYDTFWEWDKKMEMETLAPKVISWRVKWLIFDPQTQQIIRKLNVNKNLFSAKFFAYLLGEKVAIQFAEREIKIFSPTSILDAKPKIVKELGFSHEVVGRFLLFESWFPDGEGFWAIGTDKFGQAKLFSIGLNGTIKKLTPDDHHLLHPKAQAYTGLGYEGGLDIEGWTSGIVTHKGRYAVLMRHKDHVCLAHFSKMRLEKEIIVLDVNKPYPSILKPLKECVVKAITLDGTRLVLQEGGFTPFGEKTRVWIWDIEAETVRPLAEIGWIEEVYGWLGEEWMIVKVRSGTFEVEIEHDICGKIKVKKGTYEYGLLHIPPKFVKQPRPPSQRPSS